MEAEVGWLLCTSQPEFSAELKVLSSQLIPVSRPEPCPSHPQGWDSGHTDRLHAYFKTF